MTSTPQNELEGRKKQLRAVREATLKASAVGDFRRFAKLTGEAASLNRRIEELTQATP